MRILADSFCAIVAPLADDYDAASEGSPLTEEPSALVHFSTLDKIHSRSGRMSTASTDAGSSCPSTARHEPQPTATWTDPDEEKYDSSEESSAHKCGDESLLRSYPLPLNIPAWEWPLTKDEKMSLLLIIDRQVLVTRSAETAALRDELSASLEVERQRAAAASLAAQEVQQSAPTTKAS